MQTPPPISKTIIWQRLQRHQQPVVVRCEELAETLLDRLAEQMRLARLPNEPTDYAFSSLQLDQDADQDRLSEWLPWLEDAGLLTSFAVWWGALADEWLQKELVTQTLAYADLPSGNDILKYWGKPLLCELRTER